MMEQYEYAPATPETLRQIWEKNIADHPGDDSWEAWRDVITAYNEKGLCQTFIVCYCGKPIGEGTLIFSPECKAISGRTALADGRKTANINALRINKAHEGKGHISRLVKLMEQAAKARGYDTLTIGVEARETRNLAIYLHWGYRRFVQSAWEDGALVLYYSKNIT